MNMLSGFSVKHLIYWCHSFFFFFFLEFTLKEPPTLQEQQSQICNSAYSHGTLGFVIEEEEEIDLPETHAGNFLKMQQKCL